ncbi:hypothetical protein [Sphingopyxis granuli]|jgi:hypothetical protein|nr:hypothetical protein [Sphingopyxis granuli]
MMEIMARYCESFARKASAFLHSVGILRAKAPLQAVHGLSAMRQIETATQ